ncbi:Protein Prrc2C [Manis pentadactyla]|nr:Protein Prrc2C [Manis pentadactyla]
MPAPRMYRQQPGKDTQMAPRGSGLGERRAGMRGAGPLCAFRGRAPDAGTCFLVASSSLCCSVAKAGTLQPSGLLVFLKLPNGFPAPSSLWKEQQLGC